MKLPEFLPNMRVQMVGGPLKALLLSSLMLGLPAVAGAERIEGRPAAEILGGTPVRDWIAGRGGEDTLLGRGGGDTLLGGPGPDSLTGGPGRDRLRGGEGDDRIRAVDGRIDQVQCGPGWDVALVDPGDRVASDCEIVKGGPEPGTEPVVPVSPPPADPGGEEPDEPEVPEEPGEPKEPADEPIPVYEEHPIAMFPSGHGWTGNGVGSFGDAGPPVVVNGDRSFRITTDGAGGESIASSPELAPVDLVGSHVSVHAEVSFSNRLEEVRLRLGSGEIATDYAEATVWKEDDDPVILGSSFEYQSLPLGRFEVTGTVDWSQIDRAQLILTDKGADPVTLYTAGIYAVPTYKRATVSFAFDDGVASQYTLGLKKLSEFRMPASEYVIADTIDDPGFLTEEQLFAMQNLHRWEIGGHAALVADHNQPNGLDDLEPAELKADFDGLRTWMDERGFERRTFAYPKGAAGLEVRKYAARDYCAARVTAEGPETIPPRDPFTIRGWSINGLAAEAETVKAAVDRAVAEKSWVVLTFHNLVQGTPAASTDFSYSAFSQVVAYVNSLRAQKLLQVRTIADAVGC